MVSPSLRLLAAALLLGLAAGFRDENNAAQLDPQPGSGPEPKGELDGLPPPSSDSSSSWDSSSESSEYDSDADREPFGGGVTFGLAGLDPDMKYYAFVAKYQMKALPLGYEAAHTSLVVCDRENTAVQDVIAKFEKRCTSNRRCWNENFGLEQPLDLPSHVCTEFEFSGDSGIFVIKFGESGYYTGITKTTPGSTDVFPVGEVTKGAIDKALSMSQACRNHDNTDRYFDGWEPDYNPGTYHFLEHNCHTFVDFLLHFLELPYWEKGYGLPDWMMPENAKKNPIKAKLVKTAIPNQGVPRRSNQCR